MTVPVPQPVVEQPAPAAPTPAPTIEEVAVEPPRRVVQTKKAAPGADREAARPRRMSTLRVIENEGAWAKVSVGNAVAELRRRQVPSRRGHLHGAPAQQGARHLRGCGVSIGSGEVKTLSVELEDKQCCGE